MGYIEIEKENRELPHPNLSIYDTARMLEDIGEVWTLPIGDHPFYHKLAEKWYQFLQQLEKGLAILDIQQG